MTLTIKSGIMINNSSQKYVKEEISTSNVKETVNLHPPIGMTVSNSVDAIIKVPNLVTQKTFEETDNNEGIIYVKNVDDLFDTLES